MRTLLLFLLAAAGAWAQTPNSVTVTASKNAALQPDQVIFEVDVDSPIDSTMDDAESALQGSGVTAANFSGVNTVQSLPVVTNAQPQIQVRWSFTLPVDLANMKATTVTLTAVQKNVASKKNGMAMSFSVQGTRVSPRLAQTQTCALADVLADARSQAQKIAGAAGLSVGAVLAVSSGTQTAGAITAVFGSGVLVDPVSQPVCSLTVKFALGGL
jgi:uncharacterized protein YggE